MLKEVASDQFEIEYNSNIEFINALKPLLETTKAQLDKRCGIDPSKNIWNATTLPDGVQEWDYRMSDYDIKTYIPSLTQATVVGGMVPDNPGLFFFLIFGLGSLGGLMYILSDLKKLPGIKHNRIYHSAAMKGIVPGFQVVAVSLTVATACYFCWVASNGFFYLVCTLFLSFFTLASIYWYERKERKNPGAIGHSSVGNGWIGILLGTFLILFYVVLYFQPHYISNWVLMVDPIKQALSGGKSADRWFLYGFLYCLVMTVMGIRMLVKYRHNRYQLIRTASVIFFQLSFAFLIPEILGRLNNPAVNLMVPWPLDYSFYYDYRLDGMLVENENYFLGMHVGTSMFIWGILLTLVVVPLFTYLYGKRWYCSWVCGCGGLAETLGDPFRQQSDKSLRAWRIERYVIHAVMVAVTAMTVLLIVHYKTDNPTINLGLVEMNAFTVREYYGFLISSIFAGVVGTGFYPIMGNRMWCRYGCPLAGLMGLVQRFKSRFRITTNGGQCISCGNCSTYCEMGIDVRHYAQRGQDIVRASCVGCGVCSAVCPRGVLRLENSSEDSVNRALDVRNVHIDMDEI
jgi:polyferredoxin